MKGLLIKDLKLMKNQKNFFIIVCFICALFLFTDTDSSFVVSYVTIMFSIIAVGSISYDEQENGWSYLFTLPIKREEYVTEKYVFGLILTVGAWLVSSVLSFVVSVLQYHEDVLVNEWWGIMNLYLGIVILLLAVTIPVQLKFGAERSRIVYLVIFGAVMALVFLVSKVFKAQSVSLDAWITKLGNTQPIVFAGIVLVICTVLILISRLVSIKIMKEKEF